MISSIDEVYEYIYSFINIEKSEKILKHNKSLYSIDNIKKHLKYFPDISIDDNIIHVAGTKGKGSVSSLISYLLNLLEKNTTTFLDIN